MMRELNFNKWEWNSDSPKRYPRKHIDKLNEDLIYGRGEFSALRKERKFGSFKGKSF